MSSYINFFIRKDIDEKPYFIPLGSFSRSSHIYQAITNAPYEKIRPLKYEELSDSIRDLEVRKQKYEDTIKDIEHKITSLIPSFNNSIEEKMEEIREQQNYIDDIQEELSEIQFAIGYFCSLQEIIYDNEYQGSAKDNLIYCGIDISEPEEENMV